MTEKIGILIPLFFVVSFAACGPMFGDDIFPDRSTKGEQGRIEFNWDNGFSLSQPGVSDPMIAHSVAVMRLRRGSSYETSGLAVSSESPEIMDCKIDAGGISCESKKAGFAFIRVTSSSDGSLVDRVKIEAADISRVEIEKAPTILMEGGETKYELKSFDSKDRRLVGRGGMNFSTEPAEQPKLSAWLEGTVLLGSPNNQFVKVKAESGLGDGKVKVTAITGVSAELVIHVVSSATVDHMELSGATTDIEIGATAVFDVTAFTAKNEKIVSPVCLWNLTSADAAFSISNQYRDSVSLKANSKGTGVLTCTIGSVAKSLTISAH